MKIKKIAAGLIAGIFVLGFVIFLFACIVNVCMVSSTKSLVVNSYEALPQSQCVLVLGAQVWANGTLSTVLKDRVCSGAEIYNHGYAPKLLLSGDHGRKHYDEVNAMKQFVQNNYPAIPACDIFLDHAGFSTYQSVYRAKAVFEVENAIIVTQKFHAARCAYIAKKLGVNAVVYCADESLGFRKALRLRWFCREFGARFKAFFSVTFHAKPKYLGEKIPITGDGKLSWD